MFRAINAQKVLEIVPNWLKKKVCHNWFTTRSVACHCILYGVWGDNFQKIWNVKKFILFYYLSRYYCSIGLKMQSGNSELRPDTSSLVLMNALCTKLMVLCTSLCIRISVRGKFKKSLKIFSFFQTFYVNLFNIERQIETRLLVSGQSLECSDCLLRVLWSSNNIKKLIVLKQNDFFLLFMKIIPPHAI